MVLFLSSTVHYSAFDKAQHRLYEIYHTTEVCFERRANRALVCEHGEPELARRFQFERDPRLLLSLWIGWHDGVGRGPEGKGLYRDMVRIMNEASRQSGGCRSTAATVHPLRPWLTVADFRIH